MGHGIEQAIMRFVRSTSVTLKVLKAMIQLVSATAEFSDSAFENLPSHKLGATMEKLSYALFL